MTDDATEAIAVYKSVKCKMVCKRVCKLYAELYIALERYPLFFKSARRDPRKSLI